MSNKAESKNNIARRGMAALAIAGLALGLAGCGESSMRAENGSSYVEDGENSQNNAPEDKNEVDNIGNIECVSGNNEYPYTEYPYSKEMETAMIEACFDDFTENRPNYTVSWWDEYDPYKPERLRDEENDTGSVLVYNDVRRSNHEQFPDELCEIELRVDSSDTGQNTIMYDYVINCDGTHR